MKPILTENNNAFQDIIIKLLLIFNEILFEFARLGEDLARWLLVKFVAEYSSPWIHSVPSNTSIKCCNISEGFGVFSSISHKRLRFGRYSTYVIPLM